MRHSIPERQNLPTAQLLSPSVEIIDDFKERIIGIAKEDFWYRQYTDYDFKNEGGESLNDVKNEWHMPWMKFCQKPVTAKLILLSPMQPLSALIYLITVK